MALGDRSLLAEIGSQRPRPQSKHASNLHIFAGFTGKWYAGRTPPVFGGGSGGTPYTNPLIDSRNETIQEYNAVIDTELNGANPGPDFFSFFLGPSVNRFSLFDDPLIPNALGHATIAHLWQNALNPGAPVRLSFLLDNLSRSATAPYLKQNLLQEGNAAYVDRSHRLTAIPSVLEDGVWINTADNDARNTEDIYLSFDVAQRVTVYVSYDAAATSLPAWLGGYTDTGLTVGTDNPQAPSLRVHARAYDAGTIGLGGNIRRIRNGRYDYGPIEPRSWSTSAAFPTKRSAES